jgi:hypothetical protein
VDPDAGQHLRTQPIAKPSEHQHRLYPFDGCELASGYTEFGLPIAGHAARREKAGSCVGAVSIVWPCPGSIAVVADDACSA